MMFHRSERLFLRPLWSDDWPALLAGMREPAVAEQLSRLPWPYEEADARALASQPQAGRYPRLVITCPDAAQVLGVIGLHEGDGEPLLGYWLARAHWGQGYATEAGRGMLAIARMLGHARVVARHFIDNPASARVLEKLGFAPAGEVRMEHSAARGGLAAAVRRVCVLAKAGAPDDDGGSDAPDDGLSGAGRRRAA